jgi:hypothetical protein
MKRSVLTCSTSSLPSLDRVEGKQEVAGQRSGTSWEIDAKGVRVGNEGFVIVEFRRYTTSRQNQQQMGGLAYQIIDTKAKGGIIVSPLGLQEGAEKVADAENIVKVLLNENCNRYEYIMRFLKKVMIAVQDTVIRTATSFAVWKSSSACQCCKVRSHASWSVALTAPPCSRLLSGYPSDLVLRTWDCQFAPAMSGRGHRKRDRNPGPTVSGFQRTSSPHCQRAL